MKWLKRERATPRQAGIDLRISTPDGVVVLADSEHLHYAAKYGEHDREGWLQLIGGGTDYDPEATGQYSTVPLKIEIRARP